MDDADSAPAARLHMETQLAASAGVPTSRSSR